MGNSLRGRVDFEAVQKIQQSLESQVTSLAYICSNETLARVTRLQNTVQELGSTIQRIKEEQEGQSSTSTEADCEEEPAAADSSYEEDQVNRAVSFNLNCFHEKYANYPKAELYKCFKHLEPLLDNLKKYMYPDLHRIEYTGNAFNMLSITKEKMKFEVLVIFDGKHSDLIYSEGLRNGYAQVKPSSTKYTNHCDKMGYISPKKFCEYFSGIVRKFLYKIDDLPLRLNDDNVPVLSVYTDERCIEPWYTAELIPCFEFKTNQSHTRYIAKPLKNNADLAAWRRTYLVEEKKLLREISCKNDERMKVARTVKAMLMLNTSERFNQLSTYNITTILFQLKDKYQSHKSYFHNVIEFIKILRVNIKSGVQPHFFDDTINLLEGIHMQTLKTMCTVLDKTISNDDEFTQYISQLCTSFATPSKKFSQGRTPPIHKAHSVP